MRIFVLAGVALALVIPAASSAGTPLRVIGIDATVPQRDRTVAQANGRDVHAFYVRGYGRHLSLDAKVGCAGPPRGRDTLIGHRNTTLKSMVSGHLYRLRMPFVGGCDVVATLYGRGVIRLEILA